MAGGCGTPWTGCGGSPIFPQSRNLFADGKADRKVLNAQMRVCTGRGH
jgi:hypothetical protein